MLKDEIQKAVVASLKEGKGTEVKVFRFLLSQIQYEEIAKGRNLSDEECKIVLQKELKKRKEAIELFRKGNRQDLVDDEEKQLQMIQKYLPAQMTEGEIRKIIEEEVMQGKDLQYVGKIIGRVMARVRGNANGSLVAKLVSERIQKST
ncbi:GatB/YqeY domain-containing protein [Candidatus Gottesmanbacteria bacterium]|nr:GatB/YqeY domain-containing protein [Candidatus Gottesmanbacteria bacterium]